MLALSLVPGCGAPHWIKAYRGPVVPDAQLATLTVDYDTGVIVDGRNEFQCQARTGNGDPCGFTLRPGPHRLLVWYQNETFRSKETRWLNLSVEAGRSYSLAASEVVTLDDWWMMVFDTTGGSYNLVFGDRDDHCKACPPLQ